MKKWRYCLSLLLVLLLCFSLSACVRDTETGEQTDDGKGAFVPADARALWDKVDEQMNITKSYQMAQTASITMYQRGNEYNMVSTALVQSFHDKEYSEWTNSFKCEPLAINETTRNVSAYYDGKMFIASKNDLHDQKFYAENLSFEEYKALEDSTVENDEVDFMNCTVTKMDQQEDGTWKLHLSGYTKKVIQALTEQLGITEDMLGVDVLDAEVDLTTTADFLCQKMEVKFVFDVEEGDDIEPCFSLSATYSKYNEAQFPTEKLDEKAYTKVDDLSVLYVVEDELEVLKSAKKGKVELGLTTTTEVLGKKDVSHENDTISYGVKNGSYYYDIAANINGQHATIRYEGGLQTTANGSTPVSEEESRAFVEWLIDYATYNRQAVTDIEEKGDGKYRLEVARYDTSMIRASYEANGIRISEAKQEILVTLKDGRLHKMESELCLKGVYTYGTGINQQSTAVAITVQSVNTYEEVDAADPVTV